MDGIDVVPRMRMQRLNILSEVADRSAPRHYHCSSQILRRRGEDCIMMSYVLNAVNMTSLVVNSIVLLALVSMKHRQEWPREAYNFFALFSCLLGSIVCIDTQKIIMRFFLNVADPSTCYWLGVATILLEIIRLWLIAFLSMESYLVLMVDTRSETELSNTYKIWFRGRRRFRTILKFIATESTLHMLGIYIFVGFGGKICNLNTDDKVVRLLSYHWLTVLSTAMCAFFCLNLFCYIRSILIKSGHVNKVKNAYALTIVPAVALIYNIPLVIDRIVLSLHFVPYWYFHYCWQFNWLIVFACHCYAEFQRSCSSFRHMLLPMQAAK